MSDAQQTLFNTRSMSSAREVNRMKREKAAVAYKRVPPRNLATLLQNYELHLPDEDRVLRLFGRQACPQCGSFGPELLRWQGLDMRTKYAVRCPRCQFGTEPQPSSKKAVDLWTVTSKLMK